MSNPSDDDVRGARAALDRYHRELHGEGDIAIGRALAIAVDLAAGIRGLLAYIDSHESQWDELGRLVERMRSVLDEQQWRTGR